MVGPSYAFGAPTTTDGHLRAFNKADGKLNKVVAGMLRYQVTKGRVQRIRWGVYRIVPERFPKTTRWRIMNWDR